MNFTNKTKEPNISKFLFYRKSFLDFNNTAVLLQEMEYYTWTRQNQGLLRHFKILASCGSWTRTQKKKKILEFAV